MKNLKTAILMCTHNGERFLKSQLDSIRNQTQKNISLFISDDDSSDNTINILNSYKKHFGKHFSEFKILRGPGEGFAKNFINLAKIVGDDYDFYAFADQDDIWHEDKIAFGITALNNSNIDTPCLFCSRTRLIDLNSKNLGFSKKFSVPPSFQNALVQSIAGGNTMIFNSASKKLLNELKFTKGVSSHDWILYILVTFSNGFVVYSSTPKIDYRIHDENLVGSNLGLRNLLKRVLLVFRNKWVEWNESNLYHLEDLRVVSNENEKTLKYFTKLRIVESVFVRLSLLWKSGVKRQTILGNIALIVAVILKKI